MFFFFSGKVIARIDNFWQKMDNGRCSKAPKIRFKIQIFGQSIQNVIEKWKLLKKMAKIVNRNTETMSISCSKCRSGNDLYYVQVIQIVLRSIVVVYNAVESNFLKN